MLDSQSDSEETCPQKRITCPNQCSTKQFKQVNLHRHKLNCPRRVSSSTSFVVSKTMPANEGQRTVEWQPSRYVEQLVSTNMLFKQQVQELLEVQHQAQEEITYLKQEVKELKQLVNDMQTKFEALPSQKSVKTSTSIAPEDQTLTKELRIVRDNCVAESVQMRLKLRTFQYFVGMFPLEFTLKDFAALKKRNGTWQSQPFYSHPAGYRMLFYVYPNGKDDAMGNHLSLYFSLMQGEFDDFLKWPFRGEIVLQLLDQTSNQKHATRKIAFDENTPDIYVSKPEAGKLNGWGTAKFIKLKGEGGKHILNDCLKLSVLNVKAYV